MKAVATLLVYDPIEWFQGPDGRYWRTYVDVWRETGGRRAADFEPVFLDRVGLRDTHDLIHAHLRVSRGRTFVCPAYGKTGIGEIIPDIVESLPEPLRRRARHLANHRPIPHLYHRRVQPHRLPAAWRPLPFFVLFVASERRKRLRPPGAPDERGYVSDLRRGRRRLEKLIAAARRTGEPPHVLREIEALEEFLDLHDEEAILELRYLPSADEAETGAEATVVVEARARVRAAGRGVLFTDGVLSGVRPA